MPDDAVAMPDAPTQRRQRGGAPILLPERDAARRALYATGASDRAIAKAEGVDKSSIRHWRKMRGLAPNAPSAGIDTRPMTSASSAARQALYDQGLGDIAIARIEGVNRTAIRDWRRARDLPAHMTKGQIAAVSFQERIPAERRAQVMAMLARGVRPAVIVQFWGIHNSTIIKWKRTLPAPPKLTTGQPPRYRFPSGRLASRLRPDRRIVAFDAYAAGENDPEIARKMGLDRQQIYEFRLAYRLPVMSALPMDRRKPQRPRFNGAPITPWSDPTYASIASAIGRGVARDIADDAISDVWLALAEGRMRPDEISTQARRYARRVEETFASRWTRSLDEEIGDTDGFRMIDLIRDDRSSSWLEEMGATAW